MDDITDGMWIYPRVTRAEADRLCDEAIEKLSMVSQSQRRYCWLPKALLVLIVLGVIGTVLTVWFGR